GGVLLDGRQTEDVAVPVEYLLRDAAPEDAAGLLVLPHLGETEGEDEGAGLRELGRVGPALGLGLPLRDLARLQPVVAEAAAGLLARRAPREEVEDREAVVQAGGDPDSLRGDAGLRQVPEQLA